MKLEYPQPTCRCQYFDSTSGKTGGLTQLVSNLIINIHINVMMATVIKLKNFTLEKKRFNNFKNSVQNNRKKLTKRCKNWTILILVLSLFETIQNGLITF